MVASEGSAGGPSSVFVGRRALRKAHAGAVKEALLRPVSVPRSRLSQRRAGRALRRVGLTLRLVFTTSQAGLLARGAYPVGITVLSAAMRLLKRCSGRRRDESTRSENHREMDEETGDRLEPRWRRFLAQRALSDLAQEISPWRMRNQVADVRRRRSESDSESDSDVDMKVQNGEVSFQSRSRGRVFFVESRILAGFSWIRWLAMPCSYVPNPNRIPNPIRNAHSESESERWSSFCFAGC